SASLDYYRALRDAQSEAAFFQIYGNVFALYLADKHQAEAEASATAADPRDLPFVQAALSAIEEGGYPEAVARAAYLLMRKGEPLLLSALELKQELVAEYKDLMPAVAPEQWRRIRGEQEIIARYAPEQAIATLPRLLADPRDRERLRKLLERLGADERVRRTKPTGAQIAMLGELERTIEPKPPRARKAPAARKPAPRKAKRRTAA
ncbi:MAG: poly(3-hydroxybutyrate) depolymerase, partial [Burkholderiales bacterium]|nr:poly(3-hydroxybutyrate) depolymerase [Burkholderiales bacterium]